MADNELAAKLTRRNQINEGEETTKAPAKNSVYSEFKEFSMMEIKTHRKMFDKYDSGKTGYLDLTTLKYMMEKLENPQTHLGLKAMIKEVDEDNDGRISFREFLLIFRKARSGELQSEGLAAIALASEIDVGEVGVKGAKTFFTAKADALAQTNKFENEIKEEQERKRREAEEAAVRRRAFKEKAASFDKA